MVKNFIIKGCYIELTTNCNLLCAHCYNNSGNESRSLDFQNLINVLESLKLRGIKRITLSGGEPLLYDKLYELLMYLDKNEFYSTIVTNATLMSEKKAQFIASLKNVNNIIFQVSLEGSTEKQNDVIRGAGGFHKITRAMDLMDSYGIEYFIRASLYPSNAYDIESIVQLAIKRNIKHLDFSFILPYGRAKQSNLFFSSEQKARILKYIVELHKKYINDIDILIPHFESDGCPIFGEHNDAVVIPRITASGDVFPCQLINLPQYILGNIYKDDLFNAIDSDKMNKICEFIKYKNKFNSECLQCFALPLCKYGCPAISIGTNSLSGGDGFCIYRKEVLTSILTN